VQMLALRSPDGAWLEFVESMRLSGGSVSPQPQSTPFPFFGGQ
jgi:hypothetical protein